MVHSSTRLEIRPDYDPRAIAVPYDFLKDQTISPLGRLMAGLLVSAPSSYHDQYIAHPELMADILGISEIQALAQFDELKRAGYIVPYRPHAPIALPATVLEESPPASSLGYIYVIQAGECYKIGKARDHGNRIAQHRAASPHELVEVMHERVQGYDQVERDLHKLFRHKQVRCEWFRLDSSDLAVIRGVLDDARA